MPRVDTTPVRRIKRESQQRLSRAGRSVSSDATPIKLEPPVRPKTALAESARSWRHPNELAYIRGGGAWPDPAIVRFIVEHAVGIPARSASSMDPWVRVCCVDGSTVLLPRGYRLPLMWVLKYQTMSLALVLGAKAAIRRREWDGAKFEILHIGRLCSTLVDSARAVGQEGKMERTWRCPTFDRALLRYWHDWLIMRDEFVRDFWREFGEEDYAEDVLKLNWGTWVLRGHKGFTLTKHEVASGISVAEFMEGFVVDEATGAFKWIEESAESPRTANAELLPAEINHPSKQTSSVSAKPGPLAQPSAAEISNAQVESPAEPAEHRGTTDESMVVDPPLIPAQDPKYQGTASDSMIVDDELPALHLTPAPTPATGSSVSHINQGSPAQGTGANHHTQTTQKLTGVPPEGGGSRAPGCKLFLHPKDVFTALLAERAESMEVERPRKQEKDPHQSEEITPQENEEEEEIEAESEGEDDITEGISAPPHVDNFKDDVDIDIDGLELMYPSSPEGRRSDTSNLDIDAHPDRRSPSRAGSSRRSSSPLPPLSTARFPSPAPQASALDTAEYQLVRSAQVALPAPELEFDPTRLMRAWTDEMRMLRTEVGRLRSELRAVTQAKAHHDAEPRSLMLQTSAVWGHPLQHLIAGETMAMDVDEAAPPIPEGVNYVGEDQLLPPHPRKTSSAKFASV
ncbi:hypothetical protein B0H15DRAFT_1022606 [Mycena belliarum]|uniref:Uncharacterized protein n=1 Tax=Mycena belliarum TaxID=1033014 RepID=A0AAD6U4Z3_9AGAR|nr:hypothetical protein B0H15DRAFT_1022606 [Mycena belliae]